jgi:hypothetical protein
VEVDLAWALQLTESLMQIPDGTSRDSSSLEHESEQERYLSGPAANRGMNEDSNVDKSGFISR